MVRNSANMGGAIAISDTAEPFSKFQQTIQPYRMVEQFTELEVGVIRFFMFGNDVGNNTAGIYGGGLFIEGSLGKQSSVEAILANGNTAGYGGAVASDMLMYVYNCFFAHKALQSGGAVYASLGRLYVSSRHFMHVNARISGDDFY